MRPETCGSTASSRTCNKLAKLAATDYYRNGNLRWVQKGKRRIRETQPWAAIKHDTPGATAAQTSPKAAAGHQAKGEDGSRPVPVAAPCPPLLPAAPTPPPRWRSESQLSASAPALPKPAGRAGGCRSLPSRCFIRGCAKHRRLKPGQCRRRHQTQAGSEGNASLFSPARRQTMTTFNPVYAPALVTPKGRLDTQRLQPSLYPRPVPCLISPHLTWATGGRCAAQSCVGKSLHRLLAAGGLAGALPSVPACPHAGPLLLRVHKGKKDDPPLCLYHGTCAATAHQHLQATAHFSIVSRKGKNMVLIPRVYHSYTNLLTLPFKNLQTNKTQA